MGAPINPVSSQEVPVVSQVAPSASNPATAEAAASTNGGGEVNGSTRIASLSDLKSQAPKVYKQMMESIATSMISELKRRNDRLKEIWQEARNRDKA